MPAGFGSGVVMARIAVVLPAPFGPRGPWTAPGGTSRSMPSTARFSSYA
jgi:hypothetical protein